MGHQSPLYFWGLWIWKQALGSTEFALRCSSVGATSLAAVIAAAAVGKRTGSVSAATTTGLILAFEINAIFFGTELRPYAWIMLAMAAWIAIELRTETTHRRRWQAAIAGLAFLIQPTSALGFATVTLASAILDPRRDASGSREAWWPFSPRRGYALVGLFIAAAAAWWALGDTWRQREMWSSFATIGSWNDVWQIWPWTPVMIVPAALVLVTIARTAIRIDGAAVARHLRNAESRKLLVLWGSVVAMTFAVAAASMMDGVHLWHRRYLITALPMLAAASGLAVGTWSRSFGWRNAVFSQVAEFLSLVTIVLGLIVSQGTLNWVSRHSWQLAGRGEDWRSAMAWAEENSTPGQTVGIDSGLIESLAARPDEWTFDDRRMRYLSYPGRSCYRIERPIVACRVAGERPIPQIVVARYPASALRRKLGSDVEIHAFGSLSGIKGMPVPHDTEE